MFGSTYAMFPAGQAVMKGADEIPHEPAKLPIKVKILNAGASHPFAGDPRIPLLRRL